MKVSEPTTVLLKVLQSLNPLGEESQHRLAEKFSPYSFAKKTLILRPGETMKHLYFVLEGAQRAFYFKDKEYTMAFSYPPQFCAIPDSFLMQTPSKFHLEAVTDSKMLGITFHDLQKLMQEIPEIERLIRLQHERMIVGLHDRQLELMSTTMEERFEAFCQRSFHLFNKVPHKHIASYLNIDPTNLSKLLNQKN